MGVSTFLVGCLPSYETIGFIAPVVLIALRMAQGLALGGEYGGAAIYVAEHAPHGQARLLHELHPDHRDARPAALADRHHVHADLRERQLCRGDDRGRRQAHAVRRLGLAHSVPGLDRPARHLGLDPAADAGEPGLPEDEGGRLAVEGAADGSLRPVEERQDRAARAARPRRRPGRRLVHGPVLRAVLPAEHPEGRHLHGQRADRVVADPRHRRLHRVRRAVRQDRPQADHPGRLPDRGADLLPAVQADDGDRQPGAAMRRRRTRRSPSSPTRRTARSSSIRPAPRSSPTPATSPRRCWRAAR